MVEAVSLPPVIVYPEGEEPTPVSVPTDQTTNNSLPEDVASQRATKAFMGTGQLLGKPVESFKADFLAGKENDLRSVAASAIDVENMKKKEQLLVDYSKKYGPMSSAQVSIFMDPFAPHNQLSDPATVLEKQYAKSYIGQLATAPNFLADENVMDVARREIPKQAQQTVEVADDLTTKNQILLKRIQDAEVMAGQQGWGGYLVDLAKDVTQVHQEYINRGLVPGSYDLGLGSNKQEQSNILYRKPLPDFVKNLDSIKDYLKDNPSAYVGFLKSMYGQDTFEKTLDNIFTGMAIPDATLGASVVKKVLTYNQINKAAKDMVSAAAREDPPTPGGMAGAAGDLHSSAVLQVSDGVVKGLEGSADPIKTSRSTLLTTWKQMADQFIQNPGQDLSREAVTRIHDGMLNDGADLINKIATMNRVERQPLALTSQEVINAYKDKIVKDFRGPNSMVLDVDGPFVEPVSNTKWFRMKLGDYDASLFSDAETVAGRADQVGIKGVVKGSAPEKVYVPAHLFETVDAKTGIKIPNRTAVAVKEGKVTVTHFQPTYKFDKYGATKGVPDKKNLSATDIQPIVEPRPGYVGIDVKTGKVDTQALTEATAKVEQQGLGFYLEHWIPMQETSNVMRDMMIRDLHGNLIPETISHSSATGTKSIVNSVLGWVRNSDETLALNESIQRKAVVYSQSNILQWAKELNKPIEAVKNKAAWWKPTAYIGKVTGKDVQSQFERTLDYARQTQSWLKNPGELADHYLRNYSRSPSELETKAYFNYVKLIEGDRMLGEIAEFRNRARVGAEQHKLRFVGPDGKPIYSDVFDGVQLTRMPKNDDQIFVADTDDVTKGRVRETGRFSDKEHKAIQEKLDKGQARLVEVYDIDHYPLANLSDVTRGERIRYVLSKNIESNPIGFNHVNKKEGGHFDWDYDHFIKQADMRAQKSGKHIYVGDKTIMPIESKALGANVVKLWNEAHDLMKAGDWEGVRPIAAKLGIKYQEFTGWYKAGRDEAGRPIGPKLNFNEPIYVVPKNKNILSLDDSLQLRYRFKDANGNPVNRFEDGSRTGFANNFKVAYNTERNSDFNFRTINDVGTKENPIYAHQPAKLVDALPTMNRALNRAINSAFMDDYKLYAIEHWLREAEKHLDVDGGVDAIRSAPFWHYQNPKFKSSTPTDVKWNLLSHKYKIDTFVGVPSKFDTWVHTFTEHLANEAYEKFGPEESRTIGQKARSITPIWMLQHVKNPVDFIRGVTFNYKLGLFNPAQFLVQAQTHALIWALEPAHGTAGTYAMLLHGWSRVNRNPAILDALDRYATKLNGFGSKFRPGEFLEGMRELEKTGFEHVAGEYGDMSKAYTPTTNFLQGDVTKGLRLGQTPFRLGEQSTRITAWYTAFRKFREANPTVAIGNIERGKILNDADLLTVNMSRASSSILNHGVFSMSTQFLSYQVKLAELFWSKRIDNMARARIITGFSLLYGMPNAIGVTGAPFSDNIRSHLIDDLGYIPGEKWASTMVNEGFPAWSMAMITGKGDLQAGNLENVGNRFGSQGFQNIKQALRSDIPWYNALGGAGATTAGNFIGAALDPFYQGAMSWANQNSGDAKFTIKGADLLEPWKEASTVNQAYKWWYAIQTGKWLNKNEGYVADVSPLRATMLATLGLNPQKQDDMFIKNNIVKAEESSQKSADKEFQKDWKRALEAFNNGDPEQGNQFVRNAMARYQVVGKPPEDIVVEMAKATRGLESMVDNTDFSFWQRGDRSKQPQRLEQYQRQLEMNKKQ